MLKEASRLYAASWVRDIGPELRPHEYKVEESENKTNSPKSAPKEKEPSTLEDLGNRPLCYCLIRMLYTGMKYFLILVIMYSRSGENPCTLTSRWTAN